MVLRQGWEINKTDMQMFCCHVLEFYNEGIHMVASHYISKNYRFGSLRHRSPGKDSLRDFSFSSAGLKETGRF